MFLHLETVHVSASLVLGLCVRQWAIQEIQDERSMAIAGRMRAMIWKLVVGHELVAKLLHDMAVKVGGLLVLEESLSMWRDDFCLDSNLECR